MEQDYKLCVGLWFWRNVGRAAAMMLSCVPSLASGQARASAADSTASGIYLSAADYSAGVLTHAIDCRTATHKLDRHSFRGRPYIDVTHAGTRERHQKAEIFGFRDCDGWDVRFVDGREYRVLVSAPLHMYVRDVSSIGAKGAPVTVQTNFFSVTAASALLPLTKPSLKRAYPALMRFHDQLDIVFQTDATLADYDNFHQGYKLARVLASTRE